ncbi:MAG TPA: SHOCT domain-containing protein [Solirubrobacteraceae bacterium]|jgi:hypothetical protein|nr:SHOCT domain-containing protein [Solirubrobacteraceae bacterium]
MLSGTILSGRSRRRGRNRVAAAATVLDVRAKASPPQRPFLRLTQTLTLRVEPNGEPGFEAQLTVVSTRREDERGRRALVPLPELRVGHGCPPVIVVRYDPGNPRRVELVTGPEASRVRTEHAIRGGDMLVDDPSEPDAFDDDDSLADDSPEPDQTAATNGRPAPLARRQAGRVGQPDPTAQLRALAALRDRGVVSEAEFATQKSRLLAQN